MKSTLKLFIVTTSLSIGLGLWAQPRPASAPQTQAQLCRRYANETERAKFRGSLYDRDNLLGFSNPSGPWDTGLCWWHSRFQRAANYLAYYSPEKARPSAGQLKAILEHLMERDAIVEIPGFANLREFSRAYEAEITSTLADWQKRDTLRGIMRTVNPLRDTYAWKDPAQDQTFANLEEMANAHGAVPYVMLQMPGTAAHAWLIADVRREYKTIDFRGNRRLQAFTLDVIDSNYPDEVKTVTTPLRSQQITPEFGGYGSFAIHVDFMRDLEMFQAVAKSSCQSYIPDLLPWWKPWGTY